MTNYLQTDVLIIGCGIAGGVAALQLADSGLPVTVITRAPQPQESNTYYAQGGIIYEGQTDSPDLLAEDVLRAGAGVGNREAVDILARQGPALVRDILLKRVGVPFDRNGGGTLSLAREGGHSLARIIHAADATGKAIATSLVETLQHHPQVTLLTDFTAVELLRREEPAARSNGNGASAASACGGAYLLDRSSGQILPVLAKTTILATGGLGQIFWRTSNPPGARGDGMVMAHRLGARLSDMEFVQFHPTALHQPQAPAFLISEALRGAGARLVDSTGQPFMEKYAPEWRDLAPRDIVARSIYQEMQGQAEPSVYLDLSSYLPAAEIKRRFPTIYATCQKYGIDISTEPIPVAPAAHYACGGVWVDAWGQTSVPGLLAVGEVARTGVHGANRLASTSLLEGMVWGYRAALRTQQSLDRRATLHLDDVASLRTGGTALADPQRLDQWRQAIRQVMWQQVGLVRDTSGMAVALAELRYLQGQIEQCYRRCQPTDALVGLRNMAQVARLVTTAALTRKESLGCHYRLDDQPATRYAIPPVRHAPPAAVPVGLTNAVK